MKIIKRKTEYEIEVKKILKFDEEEIIEALEYIIENKIRYETSKDILNNIIGYVSDYNFDINDIDIDDQVCLINELITTYRNCCSKNILLILENQIN